MWAGYRNQIQEWRRRGIGMNPLGGFLPSDVPGLQLWIDFSDITTLFTDAAGLIPVTSDGDVIGRANDKSGNGNDISQSTTANKPIYKVAIQNGLSIGRYDGTDFLTTAAQVISDDNFTMFAVVIAASGATAVVSQHPNVASVGRTVFITGDTADKGRLFFNNGVSHVIDSTTVALDSTAHLITTESDGAGNSWIRVDGGSKENELAGQTWTPFDTPLVLGGIKDNGIYVGDILEVLAYQTILSDINRQLVDAYLIDRWAVS